MLEPSAETKTSVLRWAAPEKLSAISIRAAVAAALVVAPLPRETSRGAISASCRFDSPGMVAIRLRRWTPWPLSDASKLCSETAAPSIAVKWLFTCSASLSSAAEPGVGYGPEEETSLASGIALAGSKASGGMPADRLLGTSCSENIEIAATTGTTSRAYL